MLKYLFWKEVFVTQQTRPNRTLRVCMDVILTYPNEFMNISLSPVVIGGIAVSRQISD